MAEQIKFGDRLFLAGEKVILDNGKYTYYVEISNDDDGNLLNGSDYSIGDQIVVPGNDLDGKGAINNLTITVVETHDPDGGIKSLTVSGLPAFKSSQLPLRITSDGEYLGETRIGNTKEYTWTDIINNATFIIKKLKNVTPSFEARNGDLVLGFNSDDVQARNHHVFIKGDLTVEGTTTTVNTETIALADPFILLNADITDSPIEDVGIEINRGSESNKLFGWDETNDQWSTYNETLNLGTGNLISADINADNLTLSGALTAASSGEHRIGNYTFNENIMSVVSGDTEIHSPSDISFYPQENIWISQGTKLIFEGTAPDEFEAKLQATSVTEDRDIILPDESGTIALQEWTARDTDERIQAKLVNVSSHIIPAEDITYDLGSPTKQFRDLYLSGNTIYMDGTELSVDGTTNNFNITNNQGTTETFASVSYVDALVTNAISDGTIDLSSYITDAELSNALANLPIFDGAYSSLTGAPTIPSDLNDFTDNSNLLTTDFTGYATQTYVDNIVANLVASAPNTLDTLNELSNALNDDANFANTVTTSLASKANVTTVTNLQSTLEAEYVKTSELEAEYVKTSELETVLFSGSYDDLTNAPIIPQNTVSSGDLEVVAFSGLYNDLLLKPALFSGDWDDLTNKPNMFGGSYLQLTDKPELFDGQYSSLVGNPTNISEFSNDMGFVRHNAEAHIVPLNDNQYNLGSTTKQWSTIYGRTVEATYADLAERYASDMPYDEGTVLVFGGEFEVTTTSQSVNVGVAGIVSINPGLKLNSDAGNSDTHPYIALKGRVPCKVIGPVSKGDLLVTSSTPGFAKSVGQLDHGHAVLGKSLETDLNNGEKMIEVFVI